MQPHDSSSSTTTSGTSISFALCIQPKCLEQSYWAAATHHTALDTLYELCNTLVWLSILPLLEGSDRALCKACLLLAVAQLALVHLTPQLWSKHRSAIISSALLLRCVLVLLAGSVPPQQRQQQQQQQPADAGQGTTAASMTAAAGLWSNLLFVLFHQQPVLIQAPLLAMTSVLQAAASFGLDWVSGSSSTALGAWDTHNASGSRGHADTATSFSSSSSSLYSSPAGAASLWHTAELQRIRQALNWGFGVLAAGGVNPVAGMRPEPTSEAAALLAVQLFVHTFGGFLLPLFVAYVVEWRSKVSFLLTCCDLSQQQQLKVLTPAAAIVRAHVLLALLLYIGWLLLLGACTWVACCAVAPLLSA